MLINPDRMKKMIENHALNTTSAYSIGEMVDDLTNNIYKEIGANTVVDLYRRNLQRTFIEAMQRLIESTDNSVEHTDIKALGRGTLMDLRTRLKSATSRDKLTRYHIDDMVARIEKVLEIQK
jgi:hypothetical protein